MAPRSGTARVPSGALIVLALAILVAGFLLGRRSAPVETPAPASPSAAPATHVPAARPDAPTAEPTPAFTTASLPPAAEPAVLPGVVPPAVVPPATPPPAVDARTSAEVARYFEEADAIQARAKYWSDPQALAKTILEQASSGSTAGFDELIRAQTGARDELARVSVPAECAEHHRRSLAVMAEGLELLAHVKTALSSGDLGGLDGLQERTRDLEREAKEVDELGRKLRQR
jgi:hypothetical protein